VQGIWESISGRSEVQREPNGKGVTMGAEACKNVKIHKKCEDYLVAMQELHTFAVS